MKILIIVGVLAVTIGILLYRRKKSETEGEKSARELYDDLQRTVERLGGPGSTSDSEDTRDPKVEALRNAASQSLRLNLIMEQAVVEMESIAGKNAPFSAQNAGYNAIFRPFC